MSRALSRTSETARKASSTASGHSLAKVSEGSQKLSEVCRKRRLALLMSKPTKNSAEFIQVLEKVKSHPQFKDFEENAAEEQVCHLTDGILLKNYFSDLLENMFVSAASSTDQDGLTRADSPTPEEHSKATERAVGRMSEMCNISIKLQLSKLSGGTRMQQLYICFASLLELKFGATHAALLIGNRKIGYTVLEWNSTGLVVPHYIHDTDDKCIFQMELQNMQEVHSQHHVEFKHAANCLDRVKQVDIMFDASQKISQRIDRLIEVIIKFNKFFYYNPFVRNCHHFVEAALAALEINPRVDDLTGNLKQYFSNLTKGFNEPPHFKSHAELDEHVSRHLTKDSHDHRQLEFYLCVYYHFHFPSRSKCCNLAEWKCEEHSCKMVEIEKRLDEEKLTLSQHFPKQP